MQAARGSFANALIYAMTFILTATCTAGETKPPESPATGERHLVLAATTTKFARIPCLFCPVYQDTGGAMETLILQERKEGRKFTHPWQPTRLNGWNSVCLSSA